MKMISVAHMQNIYDNQQFCRDLLVYSIFLKKHEQSGLLTENNASL